MRSPRGGAIGDAFNLTGLPRAAVKACPTKCWQRQALSGTAEGRGWRSDSDGVVSDRGLRNRVTKLVKRRSNDD